MRTVRSLLALPGLFLAIHSSAIGLDDIQLWSGAGTNRAALVVEWNSPEVFNNTSVPAPVANKTMVWGFRFNGGSTGSTMLASVVQADSKLYFVIAESSFGTFIDAIGYNLSGDGVIGVTDGTTTNWIIGGISTNSTVNPDAVGPVNASDLFWSGYNGPYWQTWNELGDNGGFTNSPNRGSSHYYDPVTYNHGQWASALSGIDDLPLTDGSWIGFSVSAAGYTSDTNDPAYNAYTYDEQAPPSPDGSYTAYVLHTNDYAVHIVSAVGLSTANPYTNPAAVLGRPALQFLDSGVPSRTTIINPPYDTAPDGSDVITSISAGGQITVNMGRKVYDDPNNPYGVDLIVYGNSFFWDLNTSASIIDETDLNATLFSGNAYYGHATTVSVSQDGTNWFTYTNTPALFPDNAYRWDDANDSWTDEELNPTRPLNPFVYTNEVTGLSVAGELDRFAGAAGGTGYDLAASGFPWIQFVRVEPGPGVSTTIDAIAAANPPEVGGSLFVAPDNLAAGRASFVFQHPGGTGQNLIGLNFHSVSNPTKISTVRLSEFSSFAPVLGQVTSAFKITLKPFAGATSVSYVADLALDAGASYTGNGRDLRVYQWQGTNWTSQPFIYNPSTNQVSLSGVTNLSAFVVSQIIPPQLTIQTVTNGFALQFTPVANATHVLQRSTDLASWVPVTTITAVGGQPLTLQDTNAPAGKAFYRLLVNP